MKKPTKAAKAKPVQMPTGLVFFQVMWTRQYNENEDAFGGIESTTDIGPHAEFDERGVWPSVIDQFDAEWQKVRAWLANPATPKVKR